MGESNRRALALVAVALVLVVAAVYGRVIHQQFVNFDDYIYVLENPNVRAGLTWNGLRAHLTEPYAAYWLPLTWTSLALDVSLWGPSAPAMKITNVALHALASVLLLLACHRLTRALWPSALVAAVFAVHPLHVESVAWVAERKDVLSGVFAMLVLLVYAHYAEAPTPDRLVVVVVPYALGLLAKPTLVVLPAALLLLDVWPLGRLDVTTPRATARGARDLLVEKLPLFMLAAIVGFVVLQTQATMGAREVAAWLPGRTQAAIVLESFGWYLAKTLWPSGLAAIYPVPTTPPSLVLPALAGLAVALLTVALLLAGRRRPYLAIGWLWFLGMLLPVVGLVHVGIQMRADRWMYLPMIGLSLMAAFALAEAWERFPRMRRALVGGSLVALAALGAVAWVQVGYWRDTVTLFTRAVAVTDGNYYAWDALAQQYRMANRLDAAAPAYLRALRYAPRWQRSLEQLAEMWALQGDARAAAALRAVPPQPWSDPYGAAAVGVALVRGGRTAEARPFVEDALALEPRSPELHTAMAVILARAGDRAGAETHYARALALEPRLYSTAANLAWLRATAADPARRRPEEAQELAARALAEVETLEPALLDAQAAAYAARGKFPEAIATGERALAAAERRGLTALVAPIRARLAGYRAGRAPAPDAEQWPRP